MRNFGFRRLLGLFAVAMMLAFVAGEVAAAPRVNMGSRGTKTFAAPPPTATAPNAARSSGNFAGDKRQHHRDGEQAEQPTKQIGRAHV